MAAAAAAAAEAAPELTEIPDYVHKKPVPMMPLGNTFLLVWALENFQVRMSECARSRIRHKNQERQLAQLQGHDQQLVSFLGDSVSRRKRMSTEDPSVIRVQLQRPLRMLRPWHQHATTPNEK
jgi:hypothetical protein